MSNNRTRVTTAAFAAVTDSSKCTLTSPCNAAVYLDI